MNASIMKRSQIILLVVFLLVTGGISMIVAGNKTETLKKEKETNDDVYVPIKEVKNELKVFSMESYGQVTPNSEINISFEVQGKLERGNLTMKPGTNFRKGQLLYSVDNREGYATFRARMSTFSTLLLSALPDLELEFPSERNKWIKFLNDLDPAKRLPALPEINNSKERLFITSRNIFAEYYNLEAQQLRLEKYFYIAPFSGTVLSTSAEPGAVTSPGMTVARIAKTGGFEVRVPISMEDIDIYKSKGKATFTNSDGTMVATGKIIRVSGVINQQTQSADVYYSVKALEGEKVYNGMHLNVAIETEAEKNTVTIPLTCYHDGKVMVLEDKKLVPVEVLKVHSKPDSLLVTGLSDGQILVLERIKKNKKGTKFIGIERK